jgi:AcrR family transcriptional regulator
MITLGGDQAHENPPFARARLACARAGGQDGPRARHAGRARARGAGGVRARRLPRRAHCGHHGDRPHRDRVVLTYFNGKQEVFLAVVEALDQVGLHPPTLAYLTEPHADAAALLADIAAHHRAYLETYHRNAKMMRVVEEVTNIDAAFRRGRTARAQPWIAGNREAIRRLRREARADPELDPVSAARALSTMVSRTAYVAFVLEEEGANAIDGLAETLTRLWVNALKLTPAT